MSGTFVLLLSFVGLVSCKQVHIAMPVMDITEEDSYMCFVTPMKEYDGYSLVGYEIDSVKDVAHHAAVLACEDINSNQIYWDCKAQQGSISKGRAIGLQGKDGADIEHIRMDFPEDVGIELGSKAHINYVLLQVHYKHKFNATIDDVPSTNLTLFLTKERKQYTRQTVLLASEGYIPANTEEYSSELILEWRGVPIEADTYTIHTHNYGVLVEGYIIQNGKISLIGRKSPQHHGTATYPMKDGDILRISPGDIIAARCIYRNPHTEPVKFGKGNSDEMCNFNLNFRFATEAAMTYSRTVLSFQNSQKIKWCDNEVYTSNSLCNLSRNVLN